MSAVKSPFAINLALLALLLPALAQAQSDPLEKGIQQYREAMTADAEKTLRDLAGKEADNNTAKAYLGLVLFDTGKAKEAGDLLGAYDAGAEQPGTWEMLLRSRQWIEQKKYKESRQWLDKVIESGEDELKAAKEAGNNDAALRPEAVEALALRGRLNADEKHFENGAKDLERAIEIEPRYAYAHYYAGICYSNIKRLDKMVDHFQAFLKLAPKAPEAAKVRSLLRAFQR